MSEKAASESDLIFLFMGALILVTVIAIATSHEIESLENRVEKLEQKVKP